MTNLEWLRTLLPEQFVDFLKPSCNLCIHWGNCTEDYDCIESKVAWLNAEHKEKLKSCPVCKGEMDIRRWKHDGYYLVCKDCGMHFGLDTGMAKQGIIEGGYAEEAALIDDWNTRLDTKE